MSDVAVPPMDLYQGVAGNPAIVVGSVRTDPATGNHRARWEIIEGKTESAAIQASKLRVMDLERDIQVVRIIVAAVSSERRRQSKEVFGKVIIPFNRINGHSHT